MKKKTLQRDMSRWSKKCVDIIVQYSTHQFPDLVVQTTLESGTSASFSYITVLHICIYIYVIYLFIQYIQQVFGFQLATYRRLLFEDIFVRSLSLVELF